MQALKLKYPKDHTHNIMLTPREALELLECDPNIITRLELLLTRIGVKKDVNNEEEQ